MKTKSREVRIGAIHLGRLITWDVPGARFFYQEATAREEGISKPMAREFKSEQEFNDWLTDQMRGIWKEPT